MREINALAWGDHAFRWWGTDDHSQIVVLCYEYYQFDFEKYHIVDTFDSLLVISGYPTAVACELINDSDDVVSRKINISCGKVMPFFGEMKFLDLLKRKVLQLF